MCERFLLKALLAIQDKPLEAICDREAEPAEAAEAAPAEATPAEAAPPAEGTRLDMGRYIFYNGRFVSKAQLGKIKSVAAEAAPSRDGIWGSPKRKRKTEDTFLRML